MSILFFVVFIIAVAMIGSAKLAMLLLALSAAVLITVKCTTRVATGVEVTLAESGRAAAYSSGFVLLLVLALLSAGHGHVTFGPVLLVGLLVAYVAGFMLALRTPFVPSAVIAAISAAVSGLLIWIFGALI